MTFQPGEAWTGNREGRPKKNEEMRAALKRALEIVDPATGKKNREAIALALVKEARGGNVDAIKHVFDRVDGKVTDTKQVEQSGEIRHVIEVRRSRRATNGPDPAGAPPGPAGDR